MIVELPKDIIISDIKVDHNTQNFVTESMNLTTRTKGRGTHRLEGSCNITIGNDIRAQKAWTAFLLTVRGQLNEFLLELPMNFASDNLTTNPKINGSKGIGGTLLPLTTFDGEVYAGSLFNIPNDSKAYYALNTAKEGENLQIFPALRVGLLDLAELEFIAPKIKVRFVNDKQSISYDENGLVMRATLKWIEAL